jgi:hypothetical protein
MEIANIVIITVKLVKMISVTVKIVYIQELTPLNAIVQKDYMKKHLLYNVYNVLSNVLTVLNNLGTVTHVKVTEKTYQTVHVHLELMKSSKKTVHLVITDVKLVLITTITVLLVQLIEFLNLVVIVLMELTTLKDKPIVQLVIPNSVPLVLMMQEIVSSAQEIELTHQPVSHQKDPLNLSMLEIFQSVLLKSLFVTTNVKLVNNMETTV